MAIEQVLKDLGAATAYAYAVEKGYTGTEAEFAELMASYASVAQSAAASATAAAGSATSAASSASTASAAATTATTKASEASTSATNAAGSASSAVSSATAASGSATSAAASATTASGKASEATTAATTATTAKTDAIAAKTAAQTAQTAAETAQGKAETAQEAAEDAAESVSASAAQIATNTADISDLKEDLTRAFPHDTVSGAVASFSDGADDVPMDSVIVSIDPVQSGSGDPSPDNVRPISGWSEVNVNACGVNVWDEEWAICSINWTTHIFTPAANGRFTSKNYIPVVPNRTYYVNLDTMNTVIAGYTDVSGSGGRNITVNNHTDKLLTIPSDVKYIKFGISDYGTTYNHDISINYPSTDHDYHPYSGQSINIALGQTVYGGTLDVLSGELVIDRAMVDMGTLTWTYMSSSSVFRCSASPAKNPNIICSQYATNNPYDSWGQMEDGTIEAGATDLIVKDTRYTDAATFKSAMSGVQLVYELATTTTVTLTPNELSTLLGANNIWSDAGEVIAEYRADPTLYIGRLTEPDADMIADANITSGSYFMVGNTLYKATANIASGGAITPNVNCTRKSLSEALNEINA